MTKTVWMTLLMFAGLALFASAPALAQYSRAAAESVPMKTERVKVRDDSGNVRYEKRKVRVDSDKWGNAAGNQYDLAVDGAFEGQTVAVLHFYTGEGFDFSLPKKALAQKGFSVYRWMNRAPSPEKLEKALEKACQLWIISGSTRQLNDKHLAVIKKFFDSGKGVYIWGDNQPYYADANAVAKVLFNGQMTGNLMGNQTVSLQEEKGKPGLLPNHLLTTGLEYIYEGITIATIQPNDALEPLIYGSAGNLVSAFYDHDGKRAILDGGFTRLYINWDTAGTARYVKNAAAWLVNYERFGDEVVAAKHRNPKDEEE
ncbi:hypothetical protein [Persicimonas caeni]|nr:hypothetical protein [Persicimonas caeni]